jgi:hypothetical protein
LFVEPVVHLTALLADTHQTSATQQVEVVRNGRAAERHALGDLADVELGASEKLDQVLAHRVRQRDEQVAADGQMLTERADFGIERAGVDQTANVLFVDQCNALKHVNILRLGASVGQAASSAPRIVRLSAGLPATPGSGLALDGEMLIVQCGGDIRVLRAGTGAEVARFTQGGGADEIWFNPGDGNVYQGIIGMFQHDDSDPPMP